MKKLYTYIVTEDTGLAPNPFFQWCTLALGLPNYMHARAYKGDWIAGFFRQSHYYQLLYVMEVEIRLTLHDYFYHSNFDCKKPDIQGTDEQKCGDNFYSFENGSWIQYETLHHRGNQYVKKDTRYNPPVFASRKYWYFGKNAVEVPQQFEALISKENIQINHIHSPQVFHFCEWVKGFKTGMHAYPRDFIETENDMFSIFKKI